MRIGEVAKKANVGVETIRFYEQKGLIEQPLKPVSGEFRDYPTETVQRIQFIRSAQHIGFSLVEIVELLELESGSDTMCLDVRKRAETKRTEVQFKIENLKRIREALDVLIDTCPGKGSARKCSILEAINSGELYLSPIPKGEYDGRQNT